MLARENGDRRFDDAVERRAQLARHLLDEVVLELLDLAELLIASQQLDVLGEELFGEPQQLVASARPLPCPAQCSVHCRTGATSDVVLRREGQDGRSDTQTAQARVSIASRASAASGSTVGSHRERRPPSSGDRACSGITSARPSVPPRPADGPMRIGPLRGMTPPDEDVSCTRPSIIACEPARLLGGAESGRSTQARFAARLHPEQLKTRRRAARRQSSEDLARGDSQRSYRGDPASAVPFRVVPSRVGLSRIVRRVRCRRAPRASHRLRRRRGEDLPSRVGSGSPSDSTRY